MKKFLAYSVLILVCLGLMTFKNSCLSQIWPPLSSMNILPAYVLFILLWETQWATGILVILGTGFLLDTVFFSPFGVNLLLISLLALLGLVWIEWFGKDSKTITVFFLIIPAFDWMYTSIITVLSNSTRRSFSEIIAIILLSIPVNFGIFIFYRFILPDQEVDHVE